MMGNKMNMRMGTWTLGVAFVLLLVTVGLAADVDEGDLAEVRGIVEPLFTEQDVGDESEWDLANVYVGSQSSFSNSYPATSLATDSEGVVYAAVSAHVAWAGTSTSVSLSTAVGTPASKVKILSDGRARLKESSSLASTRMTFPSIGTIQPGMQVHIEAQFKEPSGNDDTFHIFLVDSLTGEVYDGDFFGLVRDGPVEQTFVLTPMYPLIDRTVDLVCEMKNGTNDTRSTSKIFVSSITLSDVTPDGGYTGIVAYDAADATDPLTTVHQRTYGYDSTYQFYYQPVVGLTLAPMTTDLFDAGDILFVQVKSDLTIGWDETRTEIYKVTPGGNGAATLVASANLNWNSSSGGASGLAVLSDGTLLLFASTVSRLDYDAGSGTYAANSVALTRWQAFAAAAGPDGEKLYVAMRSGTINDNSKEIYEIDPYDPDDAERVSYAKLTDHVYYTRGIAFDSDGLLWATTRKSNVSGANRYFSYRKSSTSKIHYRKRLMEWSYGLRMIVAGQDGSFYATTRDADGGYQVWRIDE